MVSPNPRLYSPRSMDPDRAQEFWRSVFRMFQLSGQGKDDDALALAIRMRDEFTEWPAETNYLVAVLFARTGQPSRSLETFESALDAGMAWNDALLRWSPSLAPLQEEPRFRAIVTRSGARIKALEATTAVRVDIVAPAQGGPTYPLLLPLHGGGDALDEFAPHWHSASDAGVVLCVPQSSQRRSTDTFWWGLGETFDQQRSEADIRLAYEQVCGRFRIDRVVLGGFSQGAVMAVTLALQQRPFPSVGFICVGPGTSNLEPLLPLMEAAAARGLRGWILAGEQESRLEQVLRLHKELTARGILCHMEVVPGIGHEFPDDFRNRLTSAIPTVLG